MKRLAGNLLLAFLLTALACGAAGGQTTPGAREVAVTVDDLPATHGDLAKMREITAKLLDSLRRHGAPAVAFVNEQRLFVRGETDARTELLRAWLDAGHELGNHTFSHILIDRHPLAAYQEDVVRGETVTRMLLAERGRKLRYFRHTQLRTGPTEQYRRGLSAFLAARGYTVAPVTFDNQEWVFAGVYARAKERGDRETARRVVEGYLRHMEETFDFYEKLSRDLLGYEVKQTLLIHANELNADHFDAVAEALKRRGYAFITLERALTDRAYRLPEAQSTRGLSWLHRWWLAKGRPLRPEPREPEWVAELFRSGSR
jgi:peptidoglycan/xylan/chitin deacetylase (PgdA/CDA1 family)